MISLKSYLFRDSDRDAPEAYRHIIDLLLQGLALHSVQGERSDYERFRSDIDRFAASLTSDTTTAECLVTAGEIVRALEDYNRSTSTFIRRQHTELQKMVSMLTQTIIKIGSNSDNSVSKLRSIEKALDQLRLADDIQVLKVRLGECLETVREEAVRQKADSQDAMAALEQELQVSRQGVGAVTLSKELDPATGLPSRREAERAIRSAIASPQGKFVVVAVVSRVHAVNARFGYSVGDRILAACCQHFRAGLSAADEIYRWHGPSFLAILSRSDRVDQVRAEVRRFADTKLEETVEVRNRTVLIPVSSSWSVLQVTPPAEAVFKKIEAFTAAQVPRDYA